MWTVHTKLYREGKTHIYSCCFFTQTNLGKHVGRIQTPFGQNLRHAGGFNFIIDLNILM